MKLFFDGPTIYSFFGIMSSHRLAKPTRSITISRQWVFRGRISFFSSGFRPPKKLFVCSDGNFQISLSGSPLFDCRVRMIGRPKAPADHLLFMQQFFFKIWSFYICLPIRWTVISMKFCYIISKWCSDSKKNWIFWINFE